ncbi:MAG: type II toxin-antitoxin system RelE/ParE family toxin [Candidatus Omnitrophica bacterium]|nr:type II toxin-antitoxin system RelE/ParE family toxin [Candidatus Omnitrophota bacterium]
MLKHVYFFVDEHGRSPVEEFIGGLTEKEDMKVRAYIKILKEFGHNLRRPVADYLGEGIYELRPQAHRIFYFFFMKDSAVLLHVIRKKTDKIPINDFNLCIKRKKEVEALKNIKDSEI